MLSVCNSVFYTETGYSKRLQLLIFMRKNITIYNDYKYYFPLLFLLFLI